MSNFKLSTNCTIVVGKASKLYEKKIPITSNADLQGMGFKSVVCKLEL